MGLGGGGGGTEYISCPKILGRGRVGGGGGGDSGVQKFCFGSYVKLGGRGILVSLALLMCNL